MHIFITYNYLSNMFLLIKTKCIPVKVRKYDKFSL